MTITFSEIRTYIKRQLALIGKRYNTKEGKNLFSDVTLSSAEEDTLNIFIKSSVENIEAMLKQVITSSTYNTGSASITITNTRGDTDFATRAESLSKDYVMYNCIAEYLSTTHPDIAQTFLGSATQAMQALVSYVFYKKPPTSTANPLSATSSVS